MYSLNNNGPCINGGRPSCKTNEVAPKMTCECPSNYGGMFCEEKMENVIEIIIFCVYISFLFHRSYVLNYNKHKLQA